MTSSLAATPLRRAGLAVLLAGHFLPLLDFSIVNVALDAISHSLGASPMQLELVIAVYGVAFAVCLAMGGRLGDRYGRRRVFGWGVALFTVASLLCGLATTPDWLLGARALQGAAAALIVPQVLATIHVALQGREHSKAIGLYGAIGGLSFVIGQVLGGFMVSADIAGLGWRTVFLINLPVGLGILACLRGAIPETRAAHAARIDVPGTVLLAAVIVCLLVPLALGPTLHWPWPCFAMLAAVLPLLVLLWRVELRQERLNRAPLLPPALLRFPSTRFGMILAMLFFSSWSGFMFVLALALQAGAGLTPLQSGNAFIALGTAYFVGSVLTPRAVARFGKTGTLLVGCLVQLIGLGVLIYTLHTVWPHPTILSLIPASILMGVAQSFIVSSFFRIGLSDIPPAQAGAGSSMLTTVQQAAFGLGPALLGAVFAQTLHGVGHTYLDAVLAALGAEVILICALTFATLIYRARHAAPRTA
ncbi:MFS transporter [Alcaligenaceae bacterium C4P045]|nr:MFS transporter [Alcaligenaceae bacterium B3P038]MDQ2150920.1 MFS transporter [Alcaligenaceae bacterium C4P045]